MTKVGNVREFFLCFRSFYRKKFNFRGQTRYEKIKSRELILLSYHRAVNYH